MSTAFLTPGRLGRYIVRFLVTFIVILAPVLGSVAVPKYVPLIDAFPPAARPLTVALVSVVLSVAAVAAQFYLNEKFAKRTLRILGLIFLAAFVFTFAMLAREVVLGVVRVEYNGGNDTAAFIVGVGDRPSRCERMCAPQESDAECIENLTMKPAAIDSCWGDSRVRAAKLNMIGFYVGTMAAILLFVATLIVKERSGSA
ncbi:MAG: hypothetical protein JO257_18575 [Deltaproteobacteria bacterium]|nr:hypothetical protein [Deltaproteobacteria bacterium]